MSVTYSLTTGGYVSNPANQNGNTFGGAAARQPYVECHISLPDTISGQAVSFAGIIAPVASNGGLGAAVSLTGSSINLPAVPSSGLSLNWALQVNTTTGAVTMKTGTAATTGTQATPSADAGNIILFVHTLTNGDTIPWLRAPTLTDLN